MGRIGQHVGRAHARAPTPGRPSMRSASTSTSRPSPTSPPSNGVHVSRRAGRGRSARSRRPLLADAFATGLESTGVVPAMKHFPGLAFATRNTDAYAVTIAHVAHAARPRPQALSDGDRPPHPADHAVERDVLRVRPRERGRLVARDLDHVAARGPGLQGRDDHRLADGDGQARGGSAQLAWRSARRERGPT